MYIFSKRLQYSYIQHAITTSRNVYGQSFGLEIHKRSLSRVGVILSNEIQSTLRNLPKKVFKREIRRLLLDVLVKESDYIETPVIIQKVGLA